MTTPTEERQEKKQGANCGGNVSRRSLIKTKHEIELVRNDQRPAGGEIAIPGEAPKRDCSVFRLQ